MIKQEIQNQVTDNIKTVEAEPMTEQTTSTEQHDNNAMPGLKAQSTVRAGQWVPDYF